MVNSVTWPIRYKGGYRDCICNERLWATDEQYLYLEGWRCAKMSLEVYASSSPVLPSRGTYLTPESSNLPMMSSGRVPDTFVAYVPGT